MANTRPLRPRKTWRGRALMLWRALKGMATTPSDHGIDFTVTGHTLTGMKSVTLDAPPDKVWRAIWCHSMVDPPLATIDDVRAGETFGFFADVTQGRNLYWSHILARCEAADPGRSITLRLLALDAQPDERMAAMLNEYRVEPDGRGTRLTTRLVDELAGADEMFRSFMISAMLNDLGRIRAVLDAKRPAPPATTPPPPAKPARRSAIRRA